MPIKPPGVGAVGHVLGGSIIIDLVAPLFVSAEVGAVADNKVVLTYDEILSWWSIPATTDFSLAGTAVTIIGISIVGLTVVLQTSDVVPTADVVTVSYTKGTNPIMDPSSNEAVNLTTEAVTNNSGESTRTYFRDPFGNLILDTQNNPIIMP